jgi:hypothetical protein
MFWKTANTMLMIQVESVVVRVGVGPADLFEQQKQKRPHLAVEPFCVLQRLT